MTMQTLDQRLATPKVLGQWLWNVAPGRCRVDRKFITN